MLLKATLFAAIIVTLSACSSAPIEEAPAIPSPTLKTQEIDIEHLKLRLGMSREPESLGYEEKRFDSCQINPAPLKCGMQTLVVLNFRLQCRDSMGTVTSVSQFELLPVTSSRIHWKLGLFSGTTATDDEGYGQIEFISPGTSKSQRLSLTHHENSLGIKASDAGRVVVPKDWCK